MTKVARPFSRGERMLLVVVCLAFVHHVDHVLRADNSGWPFTSEVTPFTISLIVYPVFVADFLLLRDRVWVRFCLASVLFVALLVVHAVFEPPSHQYGTWAEGVSSVPHAVGDPNLPGVSSRLLGVVSVVISTALTLTVLGALVALFREAKSGEASGRSPRDAHA